MTSLIAIGVAGAALLLAALGAGVMMDRVWRLRLARRRLVRCREQMDRLARLIAASWPAGGRDTGHVTRRRAV